MSIKSKITTKFIVTASSLLSICLVVFIAITSNYFITRMSENNNELYEAYRISETIKSFRTNLISLDGNQKRYMLTGDARFMEQYQVKETELKTQLKSLQNYFEGQANEPTFEKLRELTYKKIIEAKDLKQSANLSGFQGATNNEENAAKTINEINATIEELNTGVSLTSKELINKSVAYLNVSKKWNLLEIGLGVIVALAGIIILFRDINLRNQLETELRNAKKQAEENATLKEQFMANVSHEIRTPMNAILGFSEVLTKTQLSPQQSEYLAAISTSGNNLLNIINDILDFSKIEAGKLSIEKISFNLHQQLQSLKVMFNEKAREKELDFTINIDNNVPVTIFGDPTRLNQVLINLIGNAIKFTNKGQVSLSCELKTIEHEVAQIVFRVKDTGIGIPSNKLNDVFERFNQGNKETTRKYGGTGLGLAIVKNLVEIQNGSITVKSKEMAGSEFVVTLSYPISYENPAEATQQKITEYTKIKPGQNKVLLVEDNVLNQKLALTYLEEFGADTAVAANGKMAIDMISSSHFDLVLMDIQMPVMDGYSAALKIRNELNLSIPVIAMTAHVFEGEREKCLSYGMSDYISKPFRQSELYAMISKYLSLSNPINESKAEIPGLSLIKENLQVVKLQELIELSRGNKSFIIEMIELFIQQNPPDIAELEQAMHSTNYEQVRMTAHRMKTSVGFLGLQQLTEPLNEIELQAENNQLTEAMQNNFNHVKQSCLMALNEFNTVLNHLRKDQ